MKKKQEKEKIVTVRIKTTEANYELGCNAVDKFNEKYPDICHQYDLSLVPAFYKNQHSIVPVYFNGKRENVRWEKFLRHRQLNKGKNDQYREVYISEWICLSNNDFFSKCGFALDGKKRHELYDKKNYRIVKITSLGLYPPEIAELIEKQIHFCLRDIKYSVEIPLGMRGETELFAGHITKNKDMMISIKKICSKYDKKTPSIGFDYLYEQSNK